MQFQLILVDRSDCDCYRNPVSNKRSSPVIGPDVDQFPQSHCFGSVLSVLIRTGSFLKGGFHSFFGYPKALVRTFSSWSDPHMCT